LELRRGLFFWFLRWPLIVKLIGANVLIVLVAGITVYLTHWSDAEAWRVLAVGGVVLLCALGINIALLFVALAPLHRLEATTRRIWDGDFDVRVRSSPLADRETARLGTTLNLLLDGLIADRSRLRVLAAEVIRAGDRERAALARELHDSTAQLMAALIYQLSAAQREAGDQALVEKLGELRGLASEILEELRHLARTAHPRVLDDLGLLAALRALGRTMADPAATQVQVVLLEGTEEDVRGLEPQVASVLYRVAQEAVRNALRHANASHVTMHLRVTPLYAAISVADDGAGFDLAHAEGQRAGLGLFTMRERVTLVDGTIRIDTVPGHGTSVQARIPRGAQHVSMNTTEERDVHE
jgi:signal transduction histidine kinase